MAKIHKTWVAVVICTVIFLKVAAAQEHLDLLQRVSENYYNLKSFEFAGHVTATVPSTDSQLSVIAIDAEAGPSFVPEHSSVLKYVEAVQYRDPKFTDVHGTPLEKDFPGFPVDMPSHFGLFEQITTDLKSQKEFPPEVIQLDGAAVHCEVLEIIYNKETWKPEESTVKYWIDAKRLIVVKEEFSELQRRGNDSILWHWVYTVDSVKLNQPPPEWLVANSAGRRDYARTEWVGRDAPDFSLLDLDGRQVKLSAMRGRVVVLDFWATWCGPCREELPILEKIRSEYKAKAVEFWGISDEEPSKVKNWMARNKTNFTTVIDPETKTSDQYEVDGIPALIVIGRDGKIVSYYTGPQTEQSLRSAIDSALNQKPTTDK